MVGPGKPGKHTVSAGTEAGVAGDSDYKDIFAIVLYIKV